MKGISVVVCCYNSSARIHETLKHLACQLVNGFDAEVILVNNNSSDDTVVRAESSWSTFNTKIPLKIVEEPAPGLSHARHTGVVHAAFDFVVFCDDDNWLDQNYLNIAVTVLNTDVQIGAAGGQGQPVYETTPPEMIVDHVTQYAVGPQSKESGDITYSKGYLYGAGIVIRKAAYFNLIQKGFTFALTDRIGQNLVSGGDFELCQAFILSGYKLYYEERLLFKHYLTSNRLNKDYLIRMNKGFGFSIAFLYPYIYLTAPKGKARSYQFILAKQSFRCLTTSVKTIFGLRSFDDNLQWIREWTAWKTLIINKKMIQKLCKELPGKSWLK